MDFTEQYPNSSDGVTYIQSTKIGIYLSKSLSFWITLHGTLHSILGFPSELGAIQISCNQKGQEGGVGQMITL